MRTPSHPLFPTETRSGKLLKVYSSICIIFRFWLSTCLFIRRCNTISLPSTSRVPESQTHFAEYRKQFLPLCRGSALCLIKCQPILLGFCSYTIWVGSEQCRCSNAASWEFRFVGHLILVFYSFLLLFYASEFVFFVSLCHISCVIAHTVL